MKYTTTSAERTVKILDRFISIAGLFAFSWLAYTGEWTLFIGSAISSVVLGTVLFWRMRLKGQ